MFKFRGFESETGSSDVTQNIEKCVNRGFDMVVSVPADEKTRTKILERLRKRIGEEKTRGVRDPATKSSLIISCSKQPTV